MDTMKLSSISPKSIKEFLIQNNIYILCAVLLIVPSIAFPGYGSADSMTVLLKNISLWGIMAIGLTFVMLLGCNDLSIGLNTSMLTVFTVMLAQRFGLWVVVPLVMVLGALSGLFNGIIVAKLNVNPFIATLGTQMVFKGIGMLMSGGSPIPNTNKQLQALFETKIIDLGFFSLTLPMVIMLACLLVATYVLKYTRFGQNIYVVGGNKEAAQLSGINTVRTTIICYMIAGVSAGITAILVTSFQTSGNAAIGERYSMQTVAACVLGGLRMTGGFGNAARAILGVAAMQLVQKVLYQIDSSLANLQVGIIGGILIIVLIVDMVSTNMSNKNRRTA